MTVEAGEGGSRTAEHIGTVINLTMQHLTADIKRTNTQSASDVDPLEQHLSNRLIMQGF